MSENKEYFCGQCDRWDSFLKGGIKGECTNELSPFFHCLTVRNDSACEHFGLSHTWSPPTFPFKLNVNGGKDD